MLLKVGKKTIHFVYGTYIKMTYNIEYAPWLGFWSVHDSFFLPRVAPNYINDQIYVGYEYNQIFLLVI